MEDFTEDAILNGLISIKQPKKGYRVAVDPIVLSSMVQVTENQTVLDVGCGVGTISLILKLRTPSASITSIDIDPKMCELCLYNSQKNHLDLEVEHIDLEGFCTASKLKLKEYDQVVTNPPFFKRESSRISETKSMANFETMELSLWISLCLKLLKPHGIFSIIHESSRVCDILTAIKGRAGSATVTPVHLHKESKAAARVIVQCIKGSKGETKIMRELNF